MIEFFELVQALALLESTCSLVWPKTNTFCSIFTAFFSLTCWAYMEESLLSVNKVFHGIINPILYLLFHNILLLFFGTMDVWLPSETLVGQNANSRYVMETVVTWNQKMGTFFLRLQYTILRTRQFRSFERVLPFQLGSDAWKKCCYMLPFPSVRNSRMVSRVVSLLLLATNLSPTGSSRAALNTAYMDVDFHLVIFQVCA